MGKGPQVFKRVYLKEKGKYYIPTLLIGQDKAVSVYRLSFGTFISPVRPRRLAQAYHIFIYYIAHHTTSLHPSAPCV